MSVKSKIQALITAANAKTGKSDTDLTAAVQSLIDVPTGEARDSSDITVSGATVNVPAGLYSSAASKAVASGTAGTPTASKGAVSNNSVTVTPSVANTTGYITGGTKTGTGVTVSASELVSGNKALTPSETAQSGIDVANFKTVSVDAISSTYVGSGVTRKTAATVAPSTSEQTICASGVYTTGAQTVSAITPNIVGDLNASRFVASIVAALAGKGVAVPESTKIDGLAALIESIQTSGGSVDQISFSLQISQGGQISDYGTFTATSGTTWADWIGSSYTFDDGLVLIIDGNGHVVNSEGIYELQYNGATVNGSDQIISGATYTLFNIYG